MRMPNLVPIGPQAATCIRPEGYTDTHTLSYIDIDVLCHDVLLPLTMSIVYLFVSVLLHYQSVIKIDVPNKWASAR